MLILYTLEYLQPWTTHNQDQASPTEIHKYQKMLSQKQPSTTYILPGPQRSLGCSVPTPAIQEHTPIHTLHTSQTVILVGLKIGVPGGSAHSNRATCWWNSWCIICSADQLYDLPQTIWARDWFWVYTFKDAYSLWRRHYQEEVQN